MWTFLLDVMLVRQTSLQHFYGSLAAGAVLAVLGLLTLGIPGAGIYAGWQWLLQGVFHSNLLPELTGDRTWPAVILVSMVALGGVYPVLHGCNLLVRLPAFANVAIAIAWSLFATLAPPLAT